MQCSVSIIFKKGGLLLSTKLKRIISIVLTVFFVLSVCSSCDREEPIVVIACSDFQNSAGNKFAKMTVESILNEIKSDGVTQADSFFCCGDYDYNFEYDDEGVKSLNEALLNIKIAKKILVQGNHDAKIGEFGMSHSGNNDPKHAKYGVFVINEDDYMRYGADEQIIKNTAKKLDDYLKNKLEDDYDSPIFVLSHLPLHYSMRTRDTGDALYANYIFDVLNNYGKKGLSIFFLFGHDHSNGWDDYLGGSCIFLKKGDSINVAHSSRTNFETKKLEFTYFNPGYVGYYTNVNNADDTLTMSVIKIYGGNVEICRYSKDGIYNLKSQGVTNSYKNEQGYLPDKKVYASPIDISLN